jgi:hypothetical protein
MMLFGRWDLKTFAVAKNVLFAIAVIYTYAKTFWFWTSRWRYSDEVVCGTKESTLFSGRFTLFSQNGKVALLVMYGIGVVILFLAIPNHVRRRSGIFAVVIRKIPSRLYCVKATALCVLCMPFYFVMIEMVEGRVRRESRGTWILARLWLELVAVQRNFIRHGHLPNSTILHQPTCQSI